MAQQHSFQAPKGTRDFYPAEMARRRYIERAWREVSIRHGFEEIDGPAFEHRELYEAKSGEGILGEMFGVFSGKDPEQVTAAGQGKAEFGLRPEFTPTLARMYAAKASSLPRPTKWFWQQNCFRAERPQRGRLREFLQWNVDYIGQPPMLSLNEANDVEIVRPTSAEQADAEIIHVIIDLLGSLGLGPSDVRVKISHRAAIVSFLRHHGADIEERLQAGFALLDRRAKIGDVDAQRQAKEIGLDDSTIPQFDELRRVVMRPGETGGPDWSKVTGVAASGSDLNKLRSLNTQLGELGLQPWCEFDLGIVRGLAYYTGMVFEVHEASGAERAIAGGGRYDNLIETFGGPPTPAVGFGMGDVVLALVLQDRGLMPDDKMLLERIGARPDVFIIPGGRDEESTAAAEKALRPLVAQLRRDGLHVRHSYKATKNVGKLLKDATSQHARLAVILESGTHATLKILDTGEQLPEPVERGNLPAAIVAALGTIAPR